MSATSLPVHESLIDPSTGDPLVALGVINGKVIWPMLGGAPEDGEDGDDGDSDEDNSDSDADSNSDNDGDSNDSDDNAGDGDDSDDDGDDDQESSTSGKKLTPEQLVAQLRKKNRSERKAKDALKAYQEKVAADLEELEKLRDEKRTDSERLEHRANKGEQTAAELKEQLEHERILRKLKLDEEDLEDFNVKGKTFDERLASATAIAEKHKLGKFADSSQEDDGDTKGKPPARAKNLKGGFKPNEDPDNETDPDKLAARIPRGF